MKKFIILIIASVLIFQIGNNLSKNNYNKESVQGLKKENINKDNNNSNTDNNYNTKNNSSNEKLEEIVENLPIEDNESLLVSLGEDEYLLDVDSEAKQITINENIYNSDKYIKFNYENIIPIINSIKDPKNLSIVEYFNLYNKISPYIDTNMSYSELLAITSNINKKDLKDSYNKIMLSVQNRT